MKYKPEFIQLICRLSMLLILTAGQCKESFEGYDERIYLYNSMDKDIWYVCDFNREGDGDINTLYVCPAQTFKWIGEIIDPDEIFVIYAVSDEVYQHHTMHEIISNGLLESTTLTVEDLKAQDRIITYPF